MSLCMYIANQKYKKNHTILSCDVMNPFYSTEEEQSGQEGH